MANSCEDVIELGSSDEESEPAPKKKKPPPNAMVHIPSKLPGITIKPARMSSLIKNRPSNSTIKRTPGPSCSRNGERDQLTTKTMHPMPGGLRNKALLTGNKLNPYATKMPAVRQTSPAMSNSFIGKIPLANKGLIRPTKMQNTFGTLIVRPTASLTNISNQVTITSNTSKLAGKGLARIAQLNSSASLQKNIPGDKIKGLNNLPPGLTIKRTNVDMKRKIPSSNVRMNPVAKRQKVQIKRQPQVVTTVDLEDDEPDKTPSAQISPQWYVRPEDQSTNTSMEAENNTEPSSDKFIEITIEDSPVKPAPTKKAGEVEKDIAITIEDSPAKATPKKAMKLNKEAESGSDDEQSAVTKTPKSKKKLNYPQNVGETVEIEIEPIEKPTQDKREQHLEIEFEPLQGKEAEPEKTETVETKEKSAAIAQNNIIIEIEESPVRPVKQPYNIITTPKKKKHIEKPKPINLESDDSKEKSPFHPVYQSFIDLCFHLENSDDMRVIVEKKIKSYYLQVPKDYTESDEFVEMVSSKMESMKANPDKMYLYIKDVVDELNLQRKVAKAELLNKFKSKVLEAEEPPEPVEVIEGESEADTRRRRQVRKLEKTLKKLHRAINKLEEQEVDFDDDGDSVYILTERYKERLVRVHAKLCQLSNTKMPSEPRIHIEPRPGQPAGPAKRIEKWINRKVPMGTPLPFPDFHDVLRCVREANKEEHLGWNEADIMEEARDLFVRCGKKLQRRRQENEWRLAASRISNEADPAEGSDELKKQLEVNRRLAAKKESELINKYADKQNMLKLEGEEIGEKEANESPVESEDDAHDEDNDEGATLENAEERKERLRRLIKEKSNNETKEKSVVSSDMNKDKDESKTPNDTSKYSTSNTKLLKETDLPKENGDTKNVTCKEVKETSEKQEETVETKLENGKENLESKAKNSDKNDDTESQQGNKVDINKEGKDGKLNEDKDSVQSLSDDSRQMDSDVDELHLLQKLHSRSENASSTSDSSDSESPIAISDTLDSSDEVEGKKISSDVVSIENSTNSESEDVNECTLIDDGEETVDQEGTGDSNVDLTLTDSNKELLNENENDTRAVESVEQPRKQARNSNDEYSEPLEDILLASSEDEADACQVEQDSPTEVNSEEKKGDSDYVNLKDDALSIGDTVIQGTIESPTNEPVSDRQSKLAEGNTDSKIDTIFKNDDTSAGVMECDEIVDNTAAEPMDTTENDLLETTEKSQVEICERDKKDNTESGQPAETKLDDDVSNEKDVEEKRESIEIADESPPDQPKLDEDVSNEKDAEEKRESIEIADDSPPDEPKLDEVVSNEKDVEEKRESIEIADESPPDQPKLDEDVSNEKDAEEKRESIEKADDSPPGEPKLDEVVSNEKDVEEKRESIEIADDSPPDEPKLDVVVSNEKDVEEKRESIEIADDSSLECDRDSFVSQINKEVNEKTDSTLAEDVPKPIEA